MQRRNRLAIGFAVAFVLGTGLLAADRGGVLAWTGVLVGVVLLVKLFALPSRWDVRVCLTAMLLWGVAWAGTLYYVRSTWESGEVVELVIDLPSGTHAARVWVLDSGDTSLIYYDAPPAVADALLSGRPVRFTRGGVMSVRQPQARRVAEVSAQEANAIFALMTDKYGDRNAATDVYYAFLGRSRSRVPIVVRFIE